MTEEEAIENFKIYIKLVMNENYCDCNELNVISHGNYADESKNVAQAIEVLLNSLQKKDERISELEKALIDEQLKHSSELDKKDKDIQRMQELLDLLDAKNVEKDKIIDKMVNTIVEDKQLLSRICNKHIKKSEDDCEKQNLLCDDCIKQYFKSKVEAEEK